MGWWFWIEGMGYGGICDLKREFGYVDISLNGYIQMDVCKWIIYVINWKIVIIMQQLLWLFIIIIITMLFIRYRYIVIAYYVLWCLLIYLYNLCLNYIIKTIDKIVNRY